MSWSDGLDRRKLGRGSPASRPRHVRGVIGWLEAGFTLLEVLLSIGIIALLAGVLVGGAANMVSDQPVTPYELFWKSVQEARKSALKSEHDIRLKFDAEKKEFFLVDGLASPTEEVGVQREEIRLKAFPISAKHAADLTVDFLGPVSKGANMILVGGVVLESKTIPYVTFYSDGTCAPFRAQFVRNGGSSTLAIDPWTCAPILTPPDPNAPPPF
jgi:general secretion pathway protein H